VEIELNWSAPISFSELFSDVPSIKTFNTKGVYLWTDAGDILNYIGKSLGNPGLVKRQHEHYLDLIGGCSLIPGRYRKVGTQWSIGNKNDYPGVILDRDRFKDLVDSAFDYISDINVRLCPLPHLTRSEIENIEKALIYEFKPWCNTTSIKTKSVHEIKFVMCGDWPKK